MNNAEIREQIRAMCIAGQLKNAIVQFDWDGSTGSHYTLSRFRYANGDVVFDQETSTGRDTFLPNTLENARNPSFLRLFLVESAKTAVVIDRNLF